MAYEWKTYPHPYPLIHDTSVTSVLRAYLMELNNVQPPATNIHHTSVEPSHSLEIVPKTQACTPGSSSSPHGILIMEQRPDYTNVLFQDAQDPWEDFQSLLHTENTPYIVTNLDSPGPSTSKMTDADEDKYLQAEAYLDQRRMHRAQRHYEKETGDVSPSRTCGLLALRTDFDNATYNYPSVSRHESLQPLQAENFFHQKYPYPNLYQRPLPKEYILSSRLDQCALQASQISETPRLSYTAMITAVQTGQEKNLPIQGFSSEGYPDCPCLDDTDIDYELEAMRSCLMFSQQSYEESFPPLERQADAQTRVISKPYVQSPVTASGQPEEPKQYEVVLNWQTKNASAQNQTLHQLGNKIDQVASQVSQTENKVDSINNRLDQMYIHLQDRISELDTNLRRMINNHIWGPEFNKKEVEIRRLKVELAIIDTEKTRPSLFAHTTSTPVPTPTFDTYAPFYTPSKPQPPVYNQFFGFSHLQPTPQPKPSSPKKSKSKVKISELQSKASPSSPIPPEDSPKATPEPLKKDKDSTLSSSSSSLHTDHTSTDSESEYADLTSILMATKTEDPSASTTTPIVEDSSSDDQKEATTEPVPQMPPPVIDHSTKPSSASWFTFDYIPRHKWPSRLQEFAVWIDLQGTKPNAHPEMSFMNSWPAQRVLYEIGERKASKEADRKEYHQMKCCSLKRYLLESHYKRMSILFYKLNGFTSLPSELQPDLQRQLTATNLSIADIFVQKIILNFIILTEERPDYTNILFQDSQDPWEEFTSILHLAEASNAPSTSSVPPTDSPTHQYYAHLPWWKEPFAEVDSDVDNLSPSHSH
ncbi:hypothetical protein KPL71_014579 [Citrus sinensis]|uniref:Uncharacterized protein n=1 Tax=Citrus sinensis TaxID=2711 RepID=A0ACB8KCI1_CITSI|nr:hypothetical protein KPL71_014579 [Citrus sinensis]